MAAVTVGAPPAMDPGLRGPAPARTTGPAAADRFPATVRPGRTVRSWPLLVLAAPAAAEVWSGWVGIAQKTGFGLVSPLPGIWPSLHLDTSITLPVGVEAYAAYALRAWLASEHNVSPRTRRFAKWSAICSFALGMAGQVAYHLLAQAGRRGRRGPSPRSCPACRSWSWPWGPRWRTCCVPTPPQVPRTAMPPDRPWCGPRTGPPGTRANRTRTTTWMAGPVPWPLPEDRRGENPARTCGACDMKPTRHALLPGGLPRRESRFLAGPCGAAESGVPTRR
jgi:hypothetical protein